VELNAFVRSGNRTSRSLEEDRSRVEIRLNACIEHLSTRVNHRTSCLQGAIHISELHLDDLLLDQLFTELLSVAGVLDGFVHRCLMDAECARSQD